MFEEAEQRDGAEQRQPDWVWKLLTKHGTGPFNRGKQLQLVALRDDGWQVRLEFETPSFETWIKRLQRDLLLEAVLDELLDDKTLALERFMEWDRADRDFHLLRDRGLAAQIARAHQRQPDAVHLVLRGASHTAFLKDCLLARYRLKSWSTVQPLSHQLLELDRDFREEDLSSVLYVLLSVLLSGLDHQEEFIDALPPTFFEHWWAQFTPRRQEGVNAKTWAQLWFVRHEEQIPPEAQAPYRKFKAAIEQAQRGTPSQVPPSSHQPGGRGWPGLATWLVVLLGGATPLLAADGGSWRGASNTLSPWWWVVGLGGGVVVTGWFLKFQPGALVRRLQDKFGSLKESGAAQDQRDVSFRQQRPERQRHRARLGVTDRTRDLSASRAQDGGGQGDQAAQRGRESFLVVDAAPERLGQDREGSARVDQRGQDGRPAVSGLELRPSPHPEGPQLEAMFEGFEVEESADLEVNNHSRYNRRGFPAPQRRGGLLTRQSSDEPGPRLSSHRVLKQSRDGGQGRSTGLDISAPASDTRAPNRPNPARLGNDRAPVWGVSWRFRFASWVVSRVGPPYHSLQGVSTARRWRLPLLGALTVLLVAGAPAPAAGITLARLRTVGGQPKPMKPAYATMGEGRLPADAVGARVRAARAVEGEL